MEVLIKFLQSIYSRPLQGLQVAQSWREPKYLFRPPTQQQIFSFENICAIISKKMPSLAKECNLQQTMEATSSGGSFYSKYIFSDFKH